MKKINYRIDGINIIADYDLKIIYTPKGAFKNKASFIQKWQEACMLSFVNQVLIGDSGCVDDGSCVLYKLCLRYKDNEKNPSPVYTTALCLLRQFDDFQIYERLD